MSKDIQVYTAIDAKVAPAERLDILMLSTEGYAEMKTYNDLELIKEAFKGKKIAAQIERLFNQDHTLADTLIRKVRIAGIENPQNVGGESSTLTAVFSEAATTIPLEPQTTYYCKLGGKPVIPLKTGDTAPATDEIVIEGQEFTLQSVSPSWYYDFNDECGNTGGGKRKSAKYMDGMFRNCVISPPEVKADGMKYFDEKEELRTAEKLMAEIESFLRG